MIGQDVVTSRQSRLLIGMVGLGVCGVVCAPLHAEGQNGPFTLRMKFRQGEISKYQTSMGMQMSIPIPGTTGAIQQVMEMNLLQQTKVAKASPEGGGETETTILQSQGMMNGKPYAPPTSTTPIFTTFDARGNTLATKGLTKDTSNASLLNNLFGSGGVKIHDAHLPANPVKPGDTWKESIKMPALSAGAVGSTQSTFLKVESVGHYKTAKIRTWVSLPVKLMLTGNQELTQNASEAAMTLTGTLKVTVDSNFAIVEGKTVRSAGNGGGELLLTPRTAISQPASSKSKLATPKTAKITSPKGAKTVKTAVKHPPLESTITKPLKITLRLDLGNNLVE